MSEANLPVHSKQTSVFALFLRVFWMFIGNMLLGLTALYILKNQGGFALSVADVVYVATVPLLIVARYFDIARYRGATAYGEPATMDHWRRYAVGLVATATATWIVCHGLALLTG